MFTGIITHIGTVKSAVRSDQGMRLEMAVDFPLDDVELGASISHAGCCLTVIAKGEGTYDLDVSNETLALTNLGDWRIGTRVNLERALKIGDELGGHIVSGHIDGVAKLIRVVRDGESYRLTFEAPPPLHRFIAPKGSVALDGISLTVNEVEGHSFGVNIIPHTWEVTSLGGLRPGSKVNLEIDILARYMARWQETV